MTESAKPQAFFPDPFAILEPTVKPEPMIIEKNQIPDLACLSWPVWDVPHARIRLITTFPTTLMISWWSMLPTTPKEGYLSSLKIWVELSLHPFMDHRRSTMRAALRPSCSLPRTTWSPQNEPGHLYESGPVNIRIRTLTSLSQISKFYVLFSFISIFYVVFSHKCLYVSLTHKPYKYVMIPLIKRWSIFLCLFLSLLSLFFA